jgi:hypothetical protein
VRKIAAVCAALALALALPALLAPGLISPTAHALSSSGSGEFITRCTMTGEVQPVDPIMAPGGTAGHTHMFFGHYGVKATSTAASLRKQGASGGTTTCQDSKDTAAYWSPESFLNGKPFLPGCTRRAGGSGNYTCGTALNRTISVRAYYLTASGAKTRELPPGTAMMVGTPGAASAPTTMGHVYWTCGATKVNGQKVQTASSIWPYTCQMFDFPHQHGVTEVINFPSCWNGKASFTTPNGTAKVPGYIDPSMGGGTPNDLAYRPVRGCGALDRKGVTYHAVPHLSLRIHYTGLGLGPQTPGGPDTLSTNSNTIYPSSCAQVLNLTGCHTQAQEGQQMPPADIALKLSSDPHGAPGPWYTGHADYWQTWQQGKAVGPGAPYGTLNSLTYYCLDKAITCGIIHKPPYPGQH